MSLTWSADFIGCTANPGCTPGEEKPKAYRTDSQVITLSSIITCPPRTRGKPPSACNSELRFRPQRRFVQESRHLPFGTSSIRPVRLHRGTIGAHLKFHGVPNALTQLICISQMSIPVSAIQRHDSTLFCFPLCYCFQGVILVVRVYVVQEVFITYMSGLAGLKVQARQFWSSFLGLEILGWGGSGVKKTVKKVQVSFKIFVSICLVLVVLQFRKFERVSIMFVIFVILSGLVVTLFSRVTIVLISV